MAHRKDVKALLERYFAGETTLSEESELREYFASDEHTPEELLYAKALFETLAKASEAIPSKSNPVRRRKTRVSLWPYIGVGAACLAVAVTLTLKIIPLGVNNETVYCYVNGEPVTDYDRAFAYAEEMKTLINTTISKPVEYLAPIEEFNRTLDVINKMEEILGGINENDI